MKKMMITLIALTTMSALNAKKMVDFSDIYVPDVPCFHECKKGNDTPECKKCRAHPHLPKMEVS